MKQGLEGEPVRPCCVGDGVSLLRTSLHRLRRKVFGVDGLDCLVAVPVDGEHREAAQRPDHVVQQQVAVSEDQGRPDDGVGDAEALQQVLHLPLSPEVGQLGSG